MPTITVNGEKRTFDGDPNMPLLWYLRDEAGLTGTKFGCGVGVCGACTIHHRRRRRALLRHDGSAWRTASRSRPSRA